MKLDTFIMESTYKNMQKIMFKSHYKQRNAYGGTN